jgi:nitrate reductase beta subunit
MLLVSGTPYGLSTRRIATDGIDIFVDYQYANGRLERVYDAQRRIREIVDSYLRYITWDEGDDSPVAEEYGLTRDAAEAICRILA